MIKYVVLGGSVKGRYVSAKELMSLYGVPDAECIILDEADPRIDTLKIKLSEVKILRPRFDEDYSK